MKYRKVIFDPNWLEDFLLTTTHITEEQIFSKSEFAADRRKRAIIFHSMYRYAQLSHADIGTRYSVDAGIVKALVGIATSKDWEEKTFILDALQPHLPAAQYKAMQYYMKDSSERSPSDKLVSRGRPKGIDRI